MAKEMRQLELTIVSASNLPRVRRFGRMRTYAAVSIDGKSFTTDVDMEGDRNPRWNKKLEFMINELSVQRPGSHLVVNLYCKRTRRIRDKPVGHEVRIEVQDLYHRGLRKESSATYPLPETKGGTLSILFQFGEVFVPRPSAWRNCLCCGFTNCLAMVPNLVALC